ncbi:MAG TPA: hypothetical protein VHT53_07070 [Candidatus Elarobacter sp.]|nr:hypothetical protein [Candidatus Elarobacter sp.]
MSRASRTFSSIAFVAALVAAGVAAGTPRPSLAAPDACQRALDYEKAATQDSASAQARYDSAVAGLAANASCTDAEMKLVNEGYLLSMRAPAEHDLHIGNWQRDLERANMLLTQCTNWPGLRGTSAANNCTTQIKYNGVIAKNLTAQPSPAPAASASPGTARPSSGSPAPSSSAAPAPRLGPAMPPPAPPSPSPAVRR